MKISNFLLVSALTLAVTFPAIISCSNEETQNDPEILYEYQIEPNSLNKYTIDQLLDAVSETMLVNLDDIELPSIDGMDISTISIKDLIPLLKLFIDGIDNIDDIINDKTTYSTCIMKYKSIDTKGNPIWLSGRLYFKRDETKGDSFIKPDHIVLANHHTICSNAQAPSMGIGIEAAIAHNNGLVVVPDYIGYGETLSKVHPFCIPDITARNTLDMVRAAKQYFKDNGIKDIDSVPFYNEGYSQGGISALAVTKFVQTDPQAKKEFKLANTYCGGGPYYMPGIYTTYVKEDKHPYPIIVPMIMLGFHDYFPDLIDLEVEDYFSEAINNAGIIDYIRKKSNTDFEIMDSIAKVIKPIKTKGFEIGITVKTSDLVNKAFMEEGSEVYNKILQATELCDLTKDWTPESPVHFMHSVDDEWVYYLNFEKAKEAFDSNPNTYFEPIKSLLLGKHLLTGVIFYARTVCGEYMKVYDKDGNVND